MISLNLDKCKVTSFNRIRSSILFSNHLGGLKFARCDGFVMDLGFKLSNNLDPGLHIEMVRCKALIVL